MENSIQYWMSKNLPKNSVIIEAGICNGEDTEVFANLFPNGKIYGFEPIPQLFQESLCRNKKYPNVFLFELGLSEIEEKKVFYVSDRFGSVWGSSSFLKPKDHLWFHEEITFKKEIEFDCVNLNNWCEKNSINHVDLLWLDLQGVEPLIIKSSLKIISNTSYVYTEVSLIETYENVILYDDFKDYMLSIGFEVVFEDLPWKDMGNVLFKNKKQ